MSEYHLADDLDDHVAVAIREVGRTEVVDRFNALAAGDISEKSPGDFVTIADRECERVLGARLRTILDVPVVGEESTAADPAVRDALATAERAWVVDPVDGTANFVSGSTDFGVMVALVEAGEMARGWVWHPAADSMLTASRGAGTRRNGQVVTVPDAADSPTGIVKAKYMPADRRPAVLDWPTGLGSLTSGRRCAAIEYDDLVSGRIEFLAYWRTHPWDHAPCALIAAEAGLRVGRLDGSAYRPADDGTGLLAARPELWQPIADHLGAALS